MARHASHPNTGSILRVAPLRDAPRTHVLGRLSTIHGFYRMHRTCLDNPATTKSCVLDLPRTVTFLFEPTRIVACCASLLWNVPRNYQRRNCWDLGMGKKVRLQGPLYLFDRSTTCRLVRVKAEVILSPRSEPSLTSRRAALGFLFLSMIREHKYSLSK